MKSEYDMTQVRQEHHRVFATIKIDRSRTDDVNGSAVEGVLCKVFLPFKKTDKPLLYFLPTNEQEMQLRGSAVFGIEGEVLQPNGVQTLITANRVHKVSHTSDPWGPSPGQTEHVLVGEPWDLKIEHIRPAVTCEPGQKTTGSFWLSQNQLISNISGRSRHYAGVKLKKFAPLNITLAGGLEVAFELHMGYRDAPLGETVMFDEMAAEFSLPVDARADSKINDAMIQLEDVLRLVSFLGEYRCVCVGWQASDGQRITEFYRPRKVVATEPPSVHQALIDYQYVNEFIDSGYKNFANLASTVAFRRALDYVIPDDTDTLESSYIMLYAAVETLVSFFRKQEGLEFIFDDESKWDQLCADLQKWLKSHPVLRDEKVKRKLVYGKLSELTRPSFSYAFDIFCQHYNIDLGDLWPMTGTKGGDSLSAIRNKLVHGEVYSAKRYQALMGAREHLRWSVYRMIFGMLGWPVTQTKIAPERVAVSPVHKSLRQDQTILSSQL